MASQIPEETREIRLLGQNFGLDGLAGGDAHSVQMTSGAT